MISTLHGHLPLVVYPNEDIDVSPGGRAPICKVRGQALGQPINVQLTLDCNTGEVLVMSPDKMVGAFRLGDLIAAHVSQQLLRAAQERAQEGSHAQAH